MKENCCKNCKYAEGYSGLAEHYCSAKGHDIRGEQYDCPKFKENKDEQTIYPRD